MGCGSAADGSKRVATTASPAASPATMQKAARSPITLAAAPTTGPSSAPNTAAPIAVPSAAPRRSRGVASASQASALAQVSDEPNPCANRETTSAS